MGQKFHSNCILYNLQGMRLDEEDVDFVHDGDEFYLETCGRAFDMRQVIDQYKLDKVLGQGGFGKVYRAIHRKTKEVVAVKTIDISENFTRADLIDEIYKEAKILKQLSHRNIIKLYQAFVIKKELYLIIEYAGGGELQDHVIANKGLPETETRNIIRQVV